MDPVTIAVGVGVGALGGLFGNLGTDAAKMLAGYVHDLNILPRKQVRQQRSVPDIKEFKTLQSHLDDVLSFLDDEKVRTIAVLGRPGVGKTAIMKNLIEHKKINETFEKVIWIEEAKGGNKELQMEIARELKLNLDGTSTELTRRISGKLQNKKYLLLLNGVKSCIDLQDIGIPDNGNCSKVVLTAESKGVCSQMKAVNPIEVEGLSPEEAWKMFKEKVGDEIINRPDVEPVARLLVKECDGVPLLIIIAAEAFKSSQSAAEWWGGLYEFRELSDDIPDLTGYHNFFRFCYQKLSDQKKSCFLYGALHPADTKISSDYLVKCWAAEGLLGRIDDQNSLRTACNRGKHILRRLNDLYLLKAEERTDHVEVNNTLRRVALHISSEDHNCKLVIGDKTNILPSPQNVNDWEEATRIFVIDTSLSVLPNVRTCRNLCSLLLPKNRDLLTIPPSFFTTMEKLQVLNLYATGIKSLPLSTDQLTELKALFLKDCLNLTELPPKINPHLQVLDIRGCKVIFIPTSIGDLSNLRCLRVSYYKPTNTDGQAGQKTGDGKVISRLSKLEELMIDVDVGFYDQWSTQAAGVIDEVAKLDNLTSLGIIFPNIEVLSKLMGMRGTQYCQPSSFFWCIVGKRISTPEILKYLNCSIPRFMRWNYQSCDQNSPITQVFPETDALELIDHQQMTCLSDFIRHSVGEGDRHSGLNRVRGCLVDRCSKMTTIVNGNETGFILLPNLEHLHLRDLSCLSSIFEGGRLSNGSLSKLHAIVVERCGIVKIMISSNSVIQHLPNLKALTIQSCQSVINLFEITAKNQSMQMLETLELFDLEELTSIYKGKSLAWPSLKVLRVYKCPKLKTLRFSERDAAKLKLIEGEQQWWNALDAKRLKKQVSFSPLP